jgi:hypothetical protein
MMRERPGMGVWEVERLAMGSGPFAFSKGQLQVMEKWPVLDVAMPRRWYGSRSTTVHL